MSSLLVTRPEPDAARSAAHLTAMGLVPVEVPLLRRITLPADLPEPDGFAAIVLTSANAVRALDEYGAVNRFRHLPVYGVGLHTGAEAERLGFESIQHLDSDFSGLVEHLAHAGIGGPVFYPCGRHLSGDMGKSLAPFGITVRACPIYEMVIAESVSQDVIDAIESGEIGGALLYSRRSAEAFVALIGARLSPETRRTLGLLCLSEKVAGPLMDAHFVRISLADRPDEDAMMALALAFARDQNAS